MTSVLTLTLCVQLRSVPFSSTSLRERDSAKNEIEQIILQHSKPRRRERGDYLLSGSVVMLY